MKKIVFIALISIVLFSASSQASPGLPEQDGVYYKSANGDFEKLKEIVNAKIIPGPNGMLFYHTKDFSVIPADNFRSILVKGKNLLRVIKFENVQRDKLYVSPPTDRAMSYEEIRNIPFADVFLVFSKAGEAIGSQVDDDTLLFEITKEQTGAAKDGNFISLEVGDGTRYIFGVGNLTGTESK